MADIVDRRGQKNSSSAKNRKRFIDRHKDQLKEAVNDILGGAQSITDLDNSEHEVVIKPTEEPHYDFVKDSGSDSVVLTGEGKHNTGDKVKKPQSGQGQGGGASDDPDSEDNFIFTLSSKDFLDLFFENLELPNLVKKQLTESASNDRQKEGYVTVGSPARLNVLQTFKYAIGRNLAMVAALKEEIQNEKDEDVLRELKDKLKNVPVFHDVDLRYDHITQPPTIKYKSVMFCVMDVSGSMGEWEKMVAKSFYLLLHLFLRKSYTDVDIVFVSHTTEAQEVTEKEFFYGNRSGGTIMSSGIHMVRDIIDKRYPINEWNIYVAQATDGDNYAEDTETYTEAVKNLLPDLQYFVYVELCNEDGMRAYFSGGPTKSETYKLISNIALDFENINGTCIKAQKDVYQAFKGLFAKDGGD